MSKHILQNDIRQCVLELERIQESLDRHNFNSFNIHQDLEGVSNELAQMRMEQYFLNKERNDFLLNIERTLKAPNKTEAYENYEFGIELVNRGVFDKAVIYFQRSIDLNPLHYRSYIALAMVYIRLNDYRNALLIAQESIAHAPKNEKYDFWGYSYQLVAQICSFLGEDKEALKYIIQAVKRNESSDYLFDCARYEMKLSNLTKGLQVLEMCITKDPKFFSIAAIENDFKKFETEISNFLSILKKNIKDEVEELREKVINYYLPTYDDFTRITNNSDILKIATEKLSNVNGKLLDGRKRIEEFLQIDTYLSLVDSKYLSLTLLAEASTLESDIDGELNKIVENAYTRKSKLQALFERSKRDSARYYKDYEKLKEEHKKHIIKCIFLNWPFGALLLFIITTISMMDSINGFVTIITAIIGILLLSKWIERISDISERRSLKKQASESLKKYKEIETMIGNQKNSLNLISNSEIPLLQNSREKIKALF